MSSSDTDEILISVETGGVVAVILISVETSGVVAVNSVLRRVASWL